MKKHISKNEFAAELHRVASDFAANASREDVRALLKRARSDVFNRVKTRHVLKDSSARESQMVMCFDVLAAQAVESPVHTETYTKVLTFTHFKPSPKLSIVAADRQDMALAA